jgi:hypothetical protein
MKNKNTEVITSENKKELIEKAINPFKKQVTREYKASISTYEINDLKQYKLLLDSFIDNSQYDKNTKMYYCEFQFNEFKELLSYVRDIYADKNKDIDNIDMLNLDLYSKSKYDKKEIGNISNIHSKLNILNENIGYNNVKIGYRTLLYGDKNKVQHKLFNEEKKPIDSKYFTVKVFTNFDKSKNEL